MYVCVCVCVWCQLLCPANLHSLCFCTTRFEELSCFSSASTTGPLEKFPSFSSALCFFLLWPQLLSALKTYVLFLAPQLLVALVAAAGRPPTAHVGSLFCCRSVLPVPCVRRTFGLYLRTVLLVYCVLCTVYCVLCLSFCFQFIKQLLQLVASSVCWYFLTHSPTPTHPPTVRDAVVCWLGLHRYRLKATVLHLPPGE